MNDMEERLAAWLAGQIEGAGTVELDGIDRAEMGHSAETLNVTISWTNRDGQHQKEAVIRIRPPAPGLLEPYDLSRQFRVLQALEPTPVKAPRPLWLEPTGDVIGREFYVMERLPGRVYEQGYPDELAMDAARLGRMCSGLVEQLSAVHNLDLATTGLDQLGDGRDYLTRELDHWSGEIDRMRRGPVPALDQLAAALRQSHPDSSPDVTLVHGDAKPGNFAFVDGEVTAVFDWEMAAVGDPMADIGWAEVNWAMPGCFASAPRAPSADKLVRRWQELTGITPHDRPWYRAFQLYKMVAIMFVGGQLVDRGHSQDLRLLHMAYGIRSFTIQALGELGIDDAADSGAVLPRKERIAQIMDSQPK